MNNAAMLKHLRMLLAFFLRKELWASVFDAAVAHVVLEVKAAGDTSTLAGTPDGDYIAASYLARTDALAEQFFRESCDGTLRRWAAGWAGVCRQLHAALVETGDADLVFDLRSVSAGAAAMRKLAREVGLPPHLTDALAYAYVMDAGAECLTALGYEWRDGVVESTADDTFYGTEPVEDSEYDGGVAVGLGRTFDSGELDEEVETRSQVYTEQKALRAALRDAGQWDEAAAVPLDWYDVVGVNV